MADEFDGTFGFEEQTIHTNDDFGLDGVDVGLTGAAEVPVSTETIDDVDGDAYGFGGDAVEQPASNEDVFGLGETAPENAAAFVAQPETENTDAFTKWEKEHDKVLAARAEQQRAEKNQVISDAKKELEEFYVKREATIKKKKAENRSEEKQWKSDIAQTNATGSDWEKVAKYCDLKPKQEGKGGQAPKNERMRKLLVSLKNEGFSGAK